MNTELGNVFARAFSGKTNNLNLNKTKENPIGSAVDKEKKFVRFLSVSAIKKFDAEKEEAGCNRAYWYRYVQGIKEPETEALRFGKAMAVELEHYLKTGDDVLGIVARAGKHLLPTPGGTGIYTLHVEEPLGDIAAAVTAREAGASADVVRQLAGLVAGGIPLMGAADVWHRRGEYVNENGILLKEESPYTTAECIDHKSSSQIDDHVTKNGRVYSGYAKTVKQVLDDTQMIGYGANISFKNQEIDRVRLALNYYQKKSPGAAKRHGLIFVEDILKRWERTDALAREIEHVVREEDPAKVPANLKACNAFHKICHYADRCPKSLEHTLISLFTTPFGQLNSIASQETEDMSTLFNKLKKSGMDTATTPATVATTAASLAPTATAPPSPPSAVFKTQTTPTSKSSLFGRGSNGKTEGVASGVPAVRVPVQDPATVKAAEEAYRAHVESEKAKLLAEDNKTEAEAVAVTVHNTSSSVVINRTRIGAVNPPENPVRNLTEGADPLLAIVRESIKDPEIKKIADDHAAVHDNIRVAGNTIVSGTGVKPQASATTIKTSGRCPTGERQATLTAKEVNEKLVICTYCGNSRKVKPVEMSDGSFTAVVSSHNIPKDFMSMSHGGVPVTSPVVSNSTIGIEAITSHIVESESKTLPVQDGSPIMNAKPVPAAAPVAATGVQHTTIFLDTAVIGAPQPKPLSDYYNEIVKELAKEAGLLDIRMAHDGPLAFGRWKAALGVVLNSRPSPDGEYFASSINEIDTAVLAAMPSSVRIVRSVR